MSGLDIVLLDARGEEVSIGQSWVTPGGLKATLFAILNSSQIRVQLRQRGENRAQERIDSPERFGLKVKK